MSTPPIQPAPLPQAPPLPTWRNFTCGLTVEQISDLERWDDLPEPGFTADRHRTGMICVALSLADQNKFMRQYRFRRLLWPSYWVWLLRGRR